MRSSFIALLLVLGTMAARAAAPDFAQCVLCHGVEGNGNPGIRAPRIAGMEPWYIRAQLEAFAAGRRGTHVSDTSGQEMRPVAANFLAIAGIEKILAFVATFKPLPPPVTIVGDRSRGRMLYATCGACHGAKGQGNESLHAPALAARTDWYLVTQLRNYRAGARGYQSSDVNGAQMRAMAAALPDDRAVEDVVSYLNTLR
jgi:cytochrome c oxidase subunit 2